MITVIALLAAAVADPLSPARDGMVQCYDPDPAQKLCRAIGYYEFPDDGSISNLGVTRISDTPLIVMAARGPVFIQDGAECSNSPLLAKNIEWVAVDGRPLEGEALVQVRDLIIAALPETLRSLDRLCSTFHPKPDGTMQALVEIDGVPAPEFTSTVLWVRESDGWRVTP